MVITSNVAPGISIFRPLAGFRSGNSFTNRNMTGIPSGRLTKKIQCQLKLSVRNPPSVGPITDDMPNTPAIKPVYLARSAGGNMSAIVTKANAIMTPAPTP